MTMKTEKYTMDELLGIMRLLRSAEGCPWDIEQTHASIRRNMIEEAYEVCEAIDLDDKALLCEELGDVLLQVVFHSRMEEEIGSFSFEDVVDGICRKLIERHPHVFGDGTRKKGTAREVLETWDEIKKRTKNNKTGAETLDAVARSLPALMRAEKLITRAERTGFVLPGVEGESDAAAVGDKLFLAVAEAKIGGIDPEEALNAASERFIERFRRAEEACGGFEGKPEDEILQAWKASEKTGP
ncbi:MAG: MazG family protein [Clostridia bacterium]|nr:MazG family protein [Clostridia bacterium]